MIVCKICGAKFDENELKCPYCEYENVAAAQENFHRELDAVIEKREQLKKLPEEITRKKMKSLPVLAAILFLVIAFIVGGIIYYIKYGPNSSEQIEKNNMAVMEQSLENGDYAGMRDYYEDLGYDYSIYEKYAEIRNLYEDYEELKWRIDQVQYYFPTSRKEEQIEQVAKTMAELSELYNYYDECMNDTRRLANDEHLEKIWEMGRTDFMDTYFVNEELLFQILEIEYDDDVSIYNELAENVADNMLFRLK